MLRNSAQTLELSGHKMNVNKLGLDTLLQCARVGMGRDVKLFRTGWLASSTSLHYHQWTVKLLSLCPFRLPSHVFSFFGGILYTFSTLCMLYPCGPIVAGISFWVASYPQESCGNISSGNRIDEGQLLTKDQHQRIVVG